MKKLLAIFLTVVMLVLSVTAAIPVFAADAPFVVGGTNHATLEEAVEAANSGDIIYLTADYTSADDVGITVDKALTIKSAEGQKYTITITAEAVPESYWISSSANLTIEDINVVTTLGFGIKGGEFTLKNSTVDMSLEHKGTTPSGSLAVMHISGGAKVTLDKATVTHKVDNEGEGSGSIGSQSVCIKGDGSSLELINNSSITSKSRSSDSAGGRYIIFVTCDGQSTDLTTNASISVGEGCSLVNETVLGGEQRPAGIFFMSKIGVDHVVNVNLENGSVLEINTDLASYQTYYSSFVYLTGEGEYTLTDNGCEYRVTSGLASDVTFPTVKDESGEKKFYGTSAVPVANGGTLILKANTVYTFKFGKETTVIENGAGASIRTDAPYGIRFFAKVNDAAYQALIAGENVKSVTFGMVISNDEALTFNNSFFDNYSSYEGESYVTKELTYAQLAADKTFSVSLYLSEDPMLTEKGKDELQKVLYACSYYKIEYNDGTVEYVFANFDATQTARSFYRVAKAYQNANGTGNAMINGIVSKVDG